MARDLTLGDGSNAAHWVIPKVKVLPRAAAVAGGRGVCGTSVDGPGGGVAQDISSRVLVVSNPPWDKRIEGAEAAWAAMGAFLRREAAGPPAAWSSGGGGGGEAARGGGGGEAWLLSGNPDATRALRMRASAKVPLVSGGVDLRLLRYKVLPPLTLDAATGGAGDGGNGTAWGCAGCGEPCNFPSRAACFRCGAPRPPATTSTASSSSNQAAFAATSPSGSSSSDSFSSAAPPSSPAPAALPGEPESSGDIRSEAVPSHEEGAGAESFSGMTVAQLKEELRSRRLKVSGVKRELIARLLGTPA